MGEIAREAHKSLGRNSSSNVSLEEKGV